MMELQSGKWEMRPSTEETELVKTQVELEQLEIDQPGKWQLALQKDTITKDDS